MKDPASTKPCFLGFLEHTKALKSFDFKAFLLSVVCLNMLDCA